MKNGTKEEQAEYRIAIVELLGGDPKLRSKKSLIEKFIKEQMANVDGSVVMTDEFEQFWEVEKQASLKSICQTEHLDESKFNQLIDDFIFSGKLSLRDDVIGTLETKPKLLEREEVFLQVEKRLTGFVDTFYMGM